MSRVITFSRTFPATHPRKGEPTFFVERIWKSLYKLNLTGDALDVCINNYFKEVGELLAYNDIANTKYHTVRSGRRWKVGDKFSPRVWSGKPYCSKQIIIAPDIEIKKIYKFECDINGVFSIDDIYVDVTSMDVPANDGLSTEDFLNWFPVDNPFSGQIICWDENIEY